MTANRKLTFYHAPNSRSGGTLFLLEELGVPYDLHLLSLQAGEQRQPAYLAINPMGKVPAIRHGGTVVTEGVPALPGPDFGVSCPAARAIPGTRVAGKAGALVAGAAVGETVTPLRHAGPVV